MQLNDISSKHNLILHVARPAHVSTINNEHDEQEQPQYWATGEKRGNVHRFSEK